MKKSYNTDIHQKQGQELSKKLYRSISEHAKRLDDARSCARNIPDLFSPNLQILRRKLCDYCERLIFSDPVSYGRKAEELLWRKAFYDPVATVKHLKKKEYSPEDMSILLTHINAGVGFYHHLISKFQCDYNLNLKDNIDFAYINENCKKNEENLDWVLHCVHQALIHLGDLSRYKLEVYPNWEPTLAIRYYLQAVSLKPDVGMPHNQMGTLSMTQNLFLDAVYHYMRCLSCNVSFEGTTNNLLGLFEKNSKFIEQLPEQNENADCIVQPEKTEHIKRFFARFLLLIDIWYFNKKIPRVYNLCHQTFKDLEDCLCYFKPVSSENSDSPLNSEIIETDLITAQSYLTSNNLFKISVICLLCITKLQKNKSQQLSMVIAFTLAIYSQLIQNASSHIQESVLNYPLPLEQLQVFNDCSSVKQASKKKCKRKKSKLRRRKVAQVADTDESDDDDDETFSDLSSEDEDDSFISDDVLAVSSDEENDNVQNNSTNGKNAASESETKTTEESETSEKTTDFENKINEEAIKKVKRMDVNDMFEIISEESSLQCIKILNDWLLGDLEVLKSCGANTRSLIRQLTQLLNLINIDVRQVKTESNLSVADLLDKAPKLPLTEDVTLKDLEILKYAQNGIVWMSNNTTYNVGNSVKEECVLRIVKLLEFGKFVTGLEEIGISYDEDSKLFVCDSSQEEESGPSSAVMDELELQETECVGGVGVINNRHDDKDCSTTSTATTNSTVQQNVSNESKGLMKMKHMGQLWLAAEVRALESRVRGKTSLSPYLVLDADALIQYTFMVKHLVNSRKFIVLVPSAVVSALDDLKREKQEARDCIRWLESQFHRGNRFFRSQRPQERAPIPFIKYPKKKDKEMFVYIQIIECCYYLAEQQPDTTNLVTLLIGNQNVFTTNGENKEFSYVGLAKSAGVSIEPIIQFYGKWKKTSKGKR